MSLLESESSISAPSDSKYCQAVTPKTCFALYSNDRPYLLQICLCVKSIHEQKIMLQTSFYDGFLFHPHFSTGVGWLEIENREFEEGLNKAQSWRLYVHFF